MIDKVLHSSDKMDDRCKTCDKRHFDDVVYCDYSIGVPEHVCDAYSREPGADDDKDLASWG